MIVRICVLARGTESSESEAEHLAPAANVLNNGPQMTQLSLDCCGNAPYSSALLE